MAGYLPSTPLGVDDYSRFYTELYDERQMLSVSTAFQQFFVGQGQTRFSPSANDVDIDIMRGTELIAALIPRGTVSRPLGGTQADTTEQRFSSFSRTFPLAEEESNFSADQLLQRRAGENPYEGLDRIMRLREFASDAHHEHMRRIIRMSEVLASQAIRTGAMDAILGTSDTDLQYDFRRHASNSAAAGAVWTNAATDILADIDTMWDQLRRQGKVNMDMLIVGESTAPGIYNNTAIQALLDNRRIEIGMVSTGIAVPSKYNKFIAAGLTPHGFLTTTKGHRVWWFTYSDGYFTTGGTWTPYMPVDEVLGCYSGARCDRYFGPPERMPVTSAERQWYSEMFGFSMGGPNVPAQMVNGSNVIMPAAFYFDAYPSEDRKKVTMRTQYAPIYCPVQTDAFYRMTSTA